jgi:nucleotide-binding universal stress UspA family protein
MRLLKIETILVATDLTTTSAGAVVTGARLAAAIGATLHVAHVASERDELSVTPDRRREYDREIEKALPLVKSATQPQAHVVFGDPPHALSSLAHTLEADVVILGRRDGQSKAASDRPVGSMAYACVTRTLVPVLVVAEALTLPLHNTLVAVDMSEAARGSLLVAVSWSSALRDQSSTDATLTVLHVDTDADPTDDAAHMRRSVVHDADVLQRNAPGWAGVTVEQLTVKDSDPAAAISRHAVDAGSELVILGTRSSADHGLSIWGSVSAAVTRRLSIPILLVPPAVWRDHSRDVDPF